MLTGTMNGKLMTSATISNSVSHALVAGSIARLVGP